MSQVNVNTPGGGTAGEPAGSSGMGFIIGIILAILIIALLVWFFVLRGGGAGGGADNGGGGGGTDATDGGGAEPAPSGWVLTELA
jgi:hypothetical protein